jgi:O-antigen ligase
LLLVLRSRFSRTSDYRRGAKAPYKIGLAATALLALGVFGLAALLLLPELGVSVDRMLAPRARNEIATLTGRDIIWAVALDEWRRNPLFGYGASMWNDAYRIQIGLEEATSAHNQFLQSLGSAGLVGLTGLLVYVGALMLHAINARRATRGLSVAIFTTVLVRCFTETPLEVDAFLTCDFIVHLLLFHLAFCRRNRMASVVRPATSFTLSARGS